MLFHAYSWGSVILARLAKAEHDAPVGLVSRYLLHDETIPLCVGPGAATEEIVAVVGFVDKDVVGFDDEVNDSVKVGAVKDRALLDVAGPLVVLTE
jgi:hypothetical protein